MRESLSSKLIPKKRPGTPVSNGAELAVGLLVFFLIGFLLDMWLDTQPIFMIVLSVFSILGMGVRTYYAYNEQMKLHEDDRRKALSERRG
jgi:F0F1-type ATP synthase assembly protein I